MEEPAGQGAVVEVRIMNLHEEVVHQPVGPEAVHPQSHLAGAVSQSLIDPAKTMTHTHTSEYLLKDFR